MRINASVIRVVNVLAMSWLPRSQVITTLVGGEVEGEVAGEMEESWVHKPSDLFLCSLWPLVLLCYSQEAIDMPLLLLPGSAASSWGREQESQVPTMLLFILSSTGL